MNPFSSGDRDAWSGRHTPSLSGFALTVVDTDEVVRARMAMQLGETAVAIPTLDAIDGRVSGPLVIVLGPSNANEHELAAVEKLLGDRPETAAILVTNSLTTEVFRAALRAGVRDVLSAPVDTAQLRESVRRVVDALEAVSARGAASAAAPVDPVHLGRVITVFSTKGGAGKSVIATNLGVSLARSSDRPVVLVDADLQFGDVSVMLKLAPQHTIMDVVGMGDRLDMTLLQGILVRHEPSGLLVLPAPLEPAFADQVTAADMSRIIEVLRTFASHVIVDTPASFNDVVLSLVEESDDVLLVAGMDIPNIKNVKIGLQTLRLLNTPVAKLKLILNRANSKVKLDVGEIERTLQLKADALIPSDIVVPQSVNKGAAVVLDAPRSGVSKALNALAGTFVTKAPPAR